LLDLFDTELGLAVFDRNSNVPGQLLNPSPIPSQSIDQQPQFAFISKYVDIGYNVNWNSSGVDVDVLDQS
jgi:hypothetical protein